MAKITDAITHRVAELARLHLSESEVKLFTAQVDEILGYVDQLAKANVDGVEPLTHPLDLATALREDRVEPSPVDAEGRPRVLGSAPEVVDGGFKVPPIL
jgi:aspartyl-tRNA(Asn)/glutamyl-tRNA(Gln) amidotransferase subunit C